MKLSSEDKGRREGGKEGFIYDIMYQILFIVGCLDTPGAADAGQ